LHRIKTGFPERGVEGYVPGTAVRVCTGVGGRLDLPLNGRGDILSGMDPRQVNERSEDDAIAETNGKNLLDRRGMLAAAAAATAGLIGTLALPGTAVANSGDAVQVGHTGDATGADTALYGRNSMTPGGGVGVRGDASSNDGVQGFSWGEDNSGVSGKSWGSSGIGVSGTGPQYGVSGQSSGGDGVHGSSSGSGKCGVYGVNSASGCGVLGDTASGTGVMARATSGGTALKVEGRTTFTRSGNSWFPKGQSKVVIKIPGGVSANSKFLVTMQSSPGAGVFLSYVTRDGSTGMKVRLNKASTAKASFAWMVLD